VTLLFIESMPDPRPSTGLEQRDFNWIQYDQTIVFRCKRPKKRVMQQGNFWQYRCFAPEVAPSSLTHFIHFQGPVELEGILWFESGP
jgi:hypothetical protein